MGCYNFKALFVTRSFLDYRIPVYKEANNLSGGRLKILFSADYVPNRVINKACLTVGSAAIGMRGEKRIGPNSIQGFANKKFRFVYQPGILREIKKYNPDVIIGDGFYQWTSFALAHRIRWGTPLVVCYERTFHTERNAQWIRTIYRRLVLRFVDAMAVNGKLSREYSEWLGMPHDKIIVGQMAADTEGISKSAATISEAKRDEIRKQWGGPEVVFAAVGRLIKPKGISQLLESWRIFEKKVTGNCVLLIIGKGPLEGDLKQKAKKSKLQKVFFLGEIEYEDIPRYYTASDVLVMPTLEDNWSLVVPEAMACGLPILCSKYNGCYPELVEPDKNGWIFDPLDEKGTFDALKRCIDNRDRLAAMGERSRRIVADYSPKHAAKAILDACEIAIKSRKNS